jgi:hypothetical protein
MNKEILDKLKEFVAGNNLVYFVRYFDGNLWYKVWDHDFEFPVPISDIGNATFLASDRAMLFMRYMRKHLEMIWDEKKRLESKPVIE